MRLSKEQRKYPRFDLNFPANIRLPDGNLLKGKTSNISGNGAFFEYSDAGKFENEAQCTLTLFVEGKLYSEEITFNCILKNNRKNGIGLQFKTMSTNDFINFIFMLKNEYPDPDHMISQFSVNPGVQLLEEL